MLVSLKMCLILNVDYRDFDELFHSDITSTVDNVKKKKKLNLPISVSVHLQHSLQLHVKGKCGDILSERCSCQEMHSYTVTVTVSANKKHTMKLHGVTWA